MCSVVVERYLTTRVDMSGDNLSYTRSNSMGELVIVFKCRGGSDECIGIMFVEVVSK